jgi:hypothetical protein
MLRAWRRVALTTDRPAMFTSRAASTPAPMAM